MMSGGTCAALLDYAYTKREEAHINKQNPKFLCLML